MSDRFNEGLEQGIQLGMLKERKRIIKLLDSHEHIFRERVAYDLLIALIKGEQK